MSRDGGSLPLGLGCVALICLALAFVIGIVGLFLLWAAYDEQAMSREFRDQGELVAVTVVGKERMRSRSTTRSGGSHTQYWLSIVPVGSEREAGRLAVNETEHDETPVGTQLDVWRLGNGYQLDRIIANPMPYTWPAAMLFVSLGFLITFAVMVVAIRRRLT